MMAKNAGVSGSDVASTIIHNLAQFAVTASGGGRPLTDNGIPDATGRASTAGGDAPRFPQPRATFLDSWAKAKRAEEVPTVSYIGWLA